MRVIDHIRRGNYCGVGLNSVCQLFKQESWHFLRMNLQIMRENECSHEKNSFLSTLMEPQLERDQNLNTLQSSKKGGRCPPIDNVQYWVRTER